MSWKNNTSIIEFHILPFFITSSHSLFVFSTAFFALIYCSGLLSNIIFIIVICWDINLHTPMYLFLCMLSVTDLCYTTVTVPKLLYILLSGNNTVSFTQCFIQINFYLIAASAEVIVIFVMAYDRYVAICLPLYYHSILNKKACISFVVVIWGCACLNSTLLSSSILKMVFCSYIIHQFLCEAKALINISCGGTDLFYNFLYGNFLVFGFCPTVFNLLSYVKIFRVILNIKSKDGKKKAFSTCSSHLIVMVIYYVSVTSVYVIPPSNHYSLLEQTLTVFYTMVVPAINPLVYSLRNKEVKSSVQKLLTSFKAV